jgi:hypothetical protein
MVRNRCFLIPRKALYRMMEKTFAAELDERDKACTARDCEVWSEPSTSSICPMTSVRSVWWFIELADQSE